MKAADTAQGLTWEGWIHLAVIGHWHTQLRKSDQLEFKETEISLKDFKDALSGLTWDTAPWLGGLWNEHLWALLLNPDSKSC